MGKPGFPTPRSGGLFHLSRPCDSRTPPDEHRLGARASRPRRGSAGKVTAPLPSPPPAGGRESGSSPQRGEVRRWVQRRMRVGEQPMFTVAVHAAAPHNAAMKKGCSWEGCAFPDPPAGGGMGKPGFPMPLLQQPMFTLAVYAAGRRDARCKWGDGETRVPHPPARGLRPPTPSRGRRHGETRFPYTPLEGKALPRAGAWGNLVSPHPCSSSLVSR